MRRRLAIAIIGLVVAAHRDGPPALRNRTQVEHVAERQRGQEVGVIVRGIGQRVGELVEHHLIAGERQRADPVQVVGLGLSTREDVSKRS